MIDVKPYLDERNKALWEELSNSDLSITIEKESHEFGYGCYCEGKNVVIKVQLANPDPSSFAHELLHVKLRKDGVFAGGSLKNYVLSDPILKDIITSETLDVIANCMDHVKMLPWFLAMGYDNSEFLADYNDIKLDYLGYQSLYLWYEAERLQAIDRMIGTYCAMRADRNPAHNYDELYPLLKSIDDRLYSIVEKFWNDWEEYDVEKKREIWEPDYGELISDFVHDLSKYIEEMDYC